MTMAVGGMAAGFVLGCTIALYQAENWLDRYATLVATQQNASSAEAMQVLAAMKDSPYPFCSDPEIANFRELVFRSEHLKDAGRISGGTINCSATSERPLQSAWKFKPEFSQRDGSIAYSNLVPIPYAGLQRAGLQLGNGYVVFSPQLPAAPGPIPMRLEFTMNPPAGKLTGASPGGIGRGRRPDLTAEGMFRLGDTLYATRCSNAFFKCVKATTTVREAFNGEGLAVAAATTVGGLAGGFLGLLMSYMFSRSLNMDRQLRRAIANERLGLAYQPIVNLDNGRIVGAEALSRWTDEDGVEVSPDVFIPVAEAGGMIGSITKLVVRKSLQTFGETLRTHADFHLSVNVSASDLVDPGFLPMLEEAVGKAKIPPKSLVIEITESSTANRAEAVETISELRRRGHSIHIDDFGTGYSSLSYLLFLNVDTIKIDRAFIKAIGTESVTVAILPQILAMAEALKIGVVAEGVETEQQANYFSGSGRRIDGQGWLYGHPFPAEELHCLLDEQWGTSRVPVDLGPIPVVKPKVARARRLGIA
jgi:sensor c-di-GMP phosphodiesterase-like protein